MTLVQHPTEVTNAWVLMVPLFGAALLWMAYLMVLAARRRSLPRWPTLRIVFSAPAA